MSTKAEQKNATRKQLIRAFLDLNSKMPIEKIRISQIVEIAGCHRSTFYEHFFDIYDLRSREEEDLLDIQMSMIIKPALEGKLDILDTQAVMVKFNEIYRMKEDSLMVLCGRYGDPDFQKRFKDNIAETILELLELDKESIEPKYFTEFFASGMFAVLNRFHEYQDIEVEELFSFLHPIWSRFLSMIRLR